MRHERKYLINGRDINQISSWVRTHSQGFHQEHPPRIVNNIYFDTRDNSSFFGNASGANLRNKYWIRWYGENWGFLNQPVWEQKNKDAALSKKIQEQLPDLHQQELLPFLKQWPLFEQLHLEPVLCNRYYREYWLSFDGRFRLTLDAQLAFGRYSHLFEVPILYLPHVVVAEIKYKPENEHFIEEITQQWPFKLSRFSKFATGMALVNDKEITV